MTGLFTKDIRNTLGADFCLKKGEIEGTEITLRIWDFAAEERFKFLLPQYLEGSNGVIIMYNDIKAKTLEKISEEIELVKNYVGHIPIFLNVPELSSKTEEFASFTKKFTFNEITSEIGPTGERAFELLAKKILKSI